MRKTLSTLLLTKVLLMGLFCLFGSELHKIRLEEVLSIGTLNDDTLFQWVGVATDTRQYIYVTDTMDYSLKKFDAQGTLIKKTGRRGQGPGEFLAPRSLVISEECLYVTDQFRLDIQVFDKNLNYMRSFKIPAPVSDISILSKDEIAVATFSIESSGKIIILSSKGEHKREFRYTDKKLGLMMDMISFVFDPQGCLYLAYNYQDRIEKYDPQGKRTWSKKLFRIEKVKKEKIAFFTLPTQLVYKDVKMDSAGNLFILGGSFSKKPSAEVYVLSPEGKWLTTFTLPDSTHCIYIDQQNSLYSRANEGVTLKKFRLKYVFE